MANCPSCGTTNIDGTQFCVNCGAGLQAATPPAPESWRMSGDLNSGGARPADEANRPSSGYAPQTPPSYPAYTPGQNAPQYYQQQPVGAGGQPMHPAVPAIVSFFLPGIGLLFVPNKVGLGLGVFAGYVVLNIVLFILAVITLGLGTCLFLAIPLVNVGAAIHSWDEAAKSSNGQFQPLLFK